MDEFDAMLYGEQNEPQDCDEFWETVYPEGFSEEQDDGKKLVKPTTLADDADAVDLERLMWVSEVVNDGALSGEGTGTEVAGVVAALLENSRKYGFEFRFYRVDDQPET